MRILWISNANLVSDLNKASYLEMMAALLKNGHTVHFVVPGPKRSQYSHHIHCLPVIRMRYLSSLSFWLTLLIYVPIFVARKNMQVVIVEPASSVGFIFALIFRRLGSFLFVMSPPVDLTGAHALLSDLQYRFSLLMAKKFCNGVVVLSTAFKHEVCQEFGLTPASVGVVTSGVSPSLFRSTGDTSDRENLRRAYGLSNTFVIMYHGVLSLNRGLRETVEAMRLLRDSHRSIVFFVLGAGRPGSGPVKDELTRLITEKGLKDRIIMHDAVDYKQVPRYLSMCDIGVVPLPVHRWWWVSSPLKLLEYLAMGKPVVATDLPFHREVIGECGCGILIPSNEAAEIARAVQYLYAHRRLLGFMGRNGRKLVETKYTWEAKARDLEKFIRERSGEELA